MYTINVYFSGTDGNLSAADSLTSLLHKRTMTNDNAISIAFEGCGTQNKYSSSLDLGGLFTFGLASQVDAAVDKVRGELTRRKDDICHVNIYGFSRGGAGAFLLAKKLNKLPADLLARLEINLATLEPVPGNLIGSVKSDVAGYTLSKYIWDLSDCKINNMLVLYTNQLLPDGGTTFGKLVADAHAPILPAYPPECKAVIDVMYGCHKTAQYVSVGSNHIEFYDENAFITFCRVKRFLEECGTQFDFNGLSYKVNSEEVSATNDYLILLYNNYLQNKLYYPHHVVRPMHKGNQIETTISPESKYLNLHHKELCLGSNSVNAMDCSDVALKVGDLAPEPSSRCQIL